MATDLILTASSIITMDDALPRARAVGVDTGTGRITAIGSLSDVKAAAPGVAVTDLGSTVLMPGFVEPVWCHCRVTGFLCSPYRKGC